MKKKSVISFGPGAASLILIFVTLALSVLGMLTLMNARNDKVLSVRNAGVIESVYQLNSKAEETRAELDEVLYMLSQRSSDDAEYLANLGSILGAGGMINPNAEYDSLISLFKSFSTGSGVTMDVLLSLAAGSDDYAMLYDKLRLLNSLALDGDVVSWTETDGLRTLSCALKLLPLGEDARSSWIKYDLTVETAEAW